MPEYEKYNLTDMQNRFVDEYISNKGNGTQAAIAAGYSPHSATGMAKKNLNRPSIEKALEIRRRSGLTDNDVKISVLVGHLYKIAISGKGDKSQLRAIEMLMEWMRQNKNNGDEESNVIRLAYSLPERRGGGRDDTERKIVDVVSNQPLDPIENISNGQFLCKNYIEKFEKPLEQTLGW